MLGMERHTDKKRSAGRGFSHTPRPGPPEFLQLTTRLLPSLVRNPSRGGRGRVSHTRRCTVAAEKGKQKATDDADLSAALVLESAGEPRRPAGDAAAANWHAGGSGVPLPRHLLLGPPCGTSEIEEAPPSPPPAPSRPRLPALNAEDAAVALELAAVAGLEGRVMELQAALEGRLRELEQLRRRDRESEGSKGEEASKRRREGADEPEVAGAEAEVQVLQHQLGTVQESVSGMKDAMLALRLQAEEMQALEEFWKPVVPVPQPQRNNSKGEEMQALEEFWKPVVPVRQRINSKVCLANIIETLTVALVALHLRLGPERQRKCILVTLSYD